MMYCMEKWPRDASFTKFKKCREIAVKTIVVNGENRHYCEKHAKLYMQPLEVRNE